MRFRNRRALVVGGATGIGRATAIALGREGAKVFVIDSNGGDAAVTAAAVGGGNTTADVTDEKQLTRALEKAKNKLGGVNILVYTAGVQRAEEIEHTTRSDYEDMLDVNLGGFVHLMGLLVTHLRANAPVSIVTVASVAGLTDGGPGLSVYSASKGAMIAYSRSLASELAENNIRVNCVAPGWTDTPFNNPVVRHMGGESTQEELIHRTVPMKRQAEPAEIAAAICFLASDEASYITGVCLPVDGGLTI